MHGLLPTQRNTATVIAGARYGVRFVDGIRDDTQKA